MGCFHSKPAAATQHTTSSVDADEALLAMPEAPRRAEIRRARSVDCLELAGSAPQSPPLRGTPSGSLLPAPRPQGFADTARRVLGAPSPGFLQSAPAPLRDSMQALTLLTDPQGDTGRGLLAQARLQGWAETFRQHAQRHGSASLAHRAQGYGMGPLDGLLYRGELTPCEYWTAATVLALWRDSQQVPMRANQVQRAPGEPLAFGGRYTRWDDVQTFDLSVPEQRDEALQRGYCELAGRTTALHRHSLAAAVASWGQSPERFAYFVRLDIRGAWPSFGLAAYTRGITPWCMSGDRGWKSDPFSECRVPVFSLGVFAHDLSAFHPAPLAPLPRVGVDSVRSLQDQVLIDQRAVGISHGFPWSDQHRKVDADFLPTGEAGFGWHDLGHLHVGSFTVPQARRDLVLLHRALTEHCKRLDIPDTLGRFPLRKLFAARLFGLTDQSNSLPRVSASEQVAWYVGQVVAEPLADLLASHNAARIANVQSNFVARLPTHQSFFASRVERGLRKQIEASNARRSSRHVSVIDDDVERLSLEWQRLANLQVEFANGWLQARGHAQEVPASPTLPIVGIFTFLQDRPRRAIEAPNVTAGVEVLTPGAERLRGFYESVGAQPWTPGVIAEFVACRFQHVRAEP